MEQSDLQRAIEAILFAAGERVEVSRMAATLECDPADITAAADALADQLAFDRRGIRILRLDKGYQIIQALLAIGSGGLFGVGLGQGTPEMIPAYFNDFIFAVICEQLGIVFGLLVLLVYVLLIVRGVTVITFTSPASVQSKKSKPRSSAFSGESGKRTAILIGCPTRASAFLTKAKTSRIKPLMSAVPSYSLPMPRE